MSGAGHDPNKAPATGAFFIACCLLLAIPGPVRAQAGIVAPAPVQVAEGCPLDRIDEQVEVRQVFDGDTVLLRDGRTVRLLGINTPELAHDGRPAEPLAVEARRALVTLLKQADSVGLRYGPQSLDRYHRTLAHLIIDGRINVQQILLRRGLALAITVPPDLWQLDCYRQAEVYARDRRLGVWSLDYYRAGDVGQQSPGRGGFQFIQGHILHVGRSADTVWLDLAGDVSLRIDRADWMYFPHQDWGSWLGRDIVARGWLYRSRDQWQLRIRHPQNITVMSDE